MADKNKPTATDFSIIAQDCESSDGQTRHVYGMTRKTAHVKENAEKTA